MGGRTGGGSIFRSGAGWILQALALGSVASSGPALAQQTTPEVTLPEVRVIGTTPLSAVRTPRRSTPTGGSQRAPRTTTAAPAAPVPVAAEPVATDPGLIDRFKVPSNTVTLTPRISTAPSPRASRTRCCSTCRASTSTTPREIPSSPTFSIAALQPRRVVGTPQGLAVYQNGMRINEAFGDTVNWDFIPQRAINRLDVFPNNPIFGLNALGGAVSIQMKNGFNYQGREAELRGGSFWRRSGARAGRHAAGRYLVLYRRRCAQR